MKIYIGTDHAGFELKQALVAYLKELEYKVEDLGAYEYNETDDYPDFIAPVARAVASDPIQNRGIILGGSGQGEAIVANRFSDVRAAVFYGQPFETVRLSREHNNANVLSLGARFITEDEAKEAVVLWLETDFSGGERHVRRIGKIDIQYIQKEFDRWNTAKKEINKHKDQVYFRERDVFFAQIGKNVGVENNGKGKKFLRPVVVLKKINKNMFLGVPLTTQLRDGAWYQENVFIKGKQSAAVISQVRLWDSKRLVYKNGVVDKDSFQCIQKAIRKLFKVS